MGDASTATIEPEVPKDVATPAKTANSTATAAPTAKKAKKAAASQEAMPDLDADVLKEAQSLGFESALKNLASRKEVADRSAQELLSALKKSEGLVNPAKNALLGA